MPYSLDDIADFNPTLTRTESFRSKSTYSLDDIADFNPFPLPSTQAQSDDAMARSFLDTAKRRPKVRENLGHYEPAVQAGKKPKKADGGFLVDDLEIIDRPTTPSQTQGAVIAPRKKDTNWERIQKLVPLATVADKVDREKGFFEGGADAIGSSLADTADAWGDVLFGNIDTGDTILGKAADALFTPAGQPGRFSENRGEAQEGGLLAPLAEFLAGKDEPGVIVGQKGVVGRRPIVSLQSATPEQGIASGVTKFGEGLVADPEMLLMLAATKGLGHLEAYGAGAGMVPRAVSGYFAVDMGRGGWEHAQQAWEAWEKGDLGAMKEAATQALLSGYFAKKAGEHAIKGGPYAQQQRQQAELERARAMFDAMRKDAERSQVLSTPEAIRARLEVETDPAMRATLERLLNESLDQKYEDVQPQPNPYEIPESAEAISRLLEIETNPAKRAALQQALRERGFDPEGVAPQEAPALVDAATQERLRRAGMPQEADYTSEAGQRRLAALDELALRWSDGQRRYADLPRDERALIENWVEQGFGQSAGGKLPWDVYPPERRMTMDDVVGVVEDPAKAFERPVRPPADEPAEVYRQVSTGQWREDAPLELLDTAQRLYREGALWGPEDVARLRDAVAALPRDEFFDSAVNQVVERLRIEKLGELPKPPELRYRPNEIMEELGLEGKKLTREDRATIAQLGQERIAEGLGLDPRDLSMEESFFVRAEAQKAGYGTAVKALPWKVKEATPPPAPGTPQPPAGGTPAAPGAPAPSTPQPAATPALHWNLRPRRADAPPEVGHGSTAYSTQTKTPVDFEWVLDDVRNVRDSWDADYPQQYQNRNTEPKQSRMTIQSIKGKPTPEILADNPFISDGAPMTIILDGKEIGLFGNHRTRAIKELYQESPEKAAQLRAAIKRMAPSFGFDPARVDAIEQPVLRRRMRGNYKEEQLKSLVDEANQRTTAQIDPVQQAKNDSGLLSPGLMALYRPDVGGNRPLRAAANREFVEKFLDEIVAPTERPNYLGKLGLTELGERRIEAALHFRAYNDTMSLEWKADSAPEGTRNMAKALDLSAPRWAELRSRMEAGERWKELDIAPDVSEAASTLALLRQEGMPVEEYLSQIGLPGFGNVELKQTIIRTMDEYRNAPARMSEIMNEYADWVDTQGSPNQIGMFAPTTAPAAIDGWRIAVDNMRQKVAAEAAAELAKRKAKADAGQEPIEPAGGESGRNAGSVPGGEVGNRGSAGTPPGETPPAAGTIAEAPGTQAPGFRNPTDRSRGPVKYFPKDNVPPAIAAELEGLPMPFLNADAALPRGARRMEWREVRGAYFLNDFAGHVVNQALRGRAPWVEELFEKPLPGGMAVQPETHMRTLAAKLNELAGDRGAEVGMSPELRAEMRQFAEEITRVADSGKPAAFIFEQRAFPHTLRHELTHVAQFGLEQQVGKFLPVQWLKTELGQRAADAFLSTYRSYGYRKIGEEAQFSPEVLESYRADPAIRFMDGKIYIRNPMFGDYEIATEVMAVIADGRADKLGLSRTEAAQLMVEMAREAQQKRGVTPTGVIDLLQNGIRREVYERLGRESGAGARDAETAAGGQPAGDLRSGEQRGSGGRDGGPPGDTGDVRIGEPAERALRDPDSVTRPELGTTDVIAPPGAPNPGAFRRAVERSEQALQEMISGQVVSANPLHAAYHLAVVGLGRVGGVFRGGADVTGERLATRFKEQMVADYQMLVELAKLAKLPIAENPAALAQLSKGREARILRRMMSLGQIVRPLYQNKIYDLAVEHMKLKRFEELAGRNQTPNPQQNLFGQQQPVAAITEFEGGIKATDIPNLLAANEAKLGSNLGLVKQIEQQLYGFSDELMTLSRDAGILSDAQYQGIKAQNEYYVPLQRVAYLAEHMERLHGGAGIFSVSKQDIYRQIKGSQQQVVDPIQSIARNIIRTINLVERNKVALAVANLEGRPEYQGIIQKLGNPNQPRRNMPINPPEGYDVFHAMRDGKVERYAAPQAVVDTLKRLKGDGQASLLTAMLATSTSWLRAGATTLYLPFVVSNAVMDVWRASTQARLGFNPLTDYIPGLYEAVKMQFGKSVLADRMAEAGGMMSGFQESLRRAPENVADVAYPEGRSTGVKIRQATYNSTIGLLNKIAEVSEMSTRLGVARRALKRGATDMEAALDMRNATVDFNKAGTVGRLLNLFIPFLNARIQGTANMGRSFKQRPVSTLARGISTITFPAMMAYLWNTTMYPEIYDRIEDYEKDGAVPIILGPDLRARGGAGEEAYEVINIPLGEVGGLFWKPMEEVLQAARGKDHRDFLETAVYLLSLFSPIAFERDGEFSEDRLLGSILPPPAGAMVEGVANKNLYTGRQLVPQSMQDASAGEQYRTTTAPLAVGIGQTFGVSPIKVENAAGRMFGGVGRAVMDASKADLGTGGGWLDMFAGLVATGSKRFRGADLKRDDEDKVQAFEEATEEGANRRVRDARNAEVLGKQLRELEPDERQEALKRALQDGVLNKRTLDYIIDNIKKDAEGRSWLDQQLTLSPVEARALYLKSRFDHLGKDGLREELQQAAKEALQRNPSAKRPIPWLTEDVAKQFAEMIAAEQQKEREERAPIDPTRPPA